jgi:sensor domain CHASE-containing protein
MKLGTKTVITLGTIVSALFVLLYIISTQIVLEGFSHLEERYARQNVDRILRSIAGRGDDLVIKAVDWATWDDMYQFAQDRNAAFIKSSLPDACKVLKMNIVLIVDVMGKVVWNEEYNVESSRLMTDSLALLAVPGALLARFGQ